MENQNLTTLQKLSLALSPDWAKYKPIQGKGERFTIDDDEVYKTKSKSEYDRLKLQAQQDLYLQQSWKRVENEMYQKSLNYETTRIGSYSDFEAMEYYPEIAAALDIMAEESTTVNTQGKIINIYSESKRIKTIIEDLLYNRLDIHTSLPMWTRNMIKYGDNFVYLNINSQHGILGSKQLPNYEIERKESDTYEMINSIEGTKQKGVTEFLWRSRNIKFNLWQVAHFRLLGDDRRLPYGTSIVEKARRVWKQCVHEDTIIWTGCGYKKIKELTNEDIIYSYDFTNNNLVKTKINDVWKTGEKETYLLKTRYNNIKLTKTHPVLIFNGESYEYKTLDEIIIGKDYLVTPVSKVGDSTLKVKLNSDKFYIKLNDEGVLKMNSLDRNGIMEKLKVVAENDYKNVHRFIQGNGKIKYSYIDKLGVLLNLTLADVDVFYKNTKIGMVNKNLEYEGDTLFFNFFGFMLGDGWLINDTGVAFALGVYDDTNEKYIEYVKNNFKEKIRITQSKHSEFSKSVVIDSGELNEILKAFGFITGFSKKVLPNWVFNLDLDGKRAIINGLFEADGSDKYGVIGLANKNLIIGLKELCNQAGIASGKITTYPSKVKFSKLTNKTEVRQESYKLYINFNNVVDDVRHEKVISYDYIGVESVWDLTTESELHNFIGGGVVVHNCTLAEDAMLVYRLTRAPERRVFKIYVGNLDPSDVGPYISEIANKFKRTPVVDPKTGQVDLKYNQMSNEQDFFIPVRSESATNPIETLQGASNLDAIADIEFLQNKLFAAIRVPKQFLGFSQTAGDGKNLALQDVRFSRTINRIQQSVLQELNKIVIIHLYLLGFEDELHNFSLTLNNPSTQASMLQIQNLTTRVDLYKAVVDPAGNGFSTMSMTRAKKEILGWSSDEITQDLMEQRLEKAASIEFENTETVIQKTGIFDKIDRIYGDPDAPQDTTSDEESGEGGGSSGGGLGGGFGGLGGDLGGGEEAPEGEEGLGGGEEAPEGEEGLGGGEEAPEGEEELTADELPDNITENMHFNKLLTYIGDGNKKPFKAQPKTGNTNEFKKMIREIDSRLNLNS